MKKQEQAIRQCKTHLTEAEWQRLQGIKQRYGYRSDYEFTRSCVLLCMTLLEGQGLEAVVQMPEDIRERLADIVNIHLSGYRHTSQRATPLFRDEDLENRPPRAWVDKFIGIYYERLYDEFEARTQSVRERDGYTPLDIFQDTILRACLRPTTLRTYEAWEAMMLDKFKCELAIAEARHANKKQRPIIDYDCSESMDEELRLPQDYQ